MSYGDTHYTLVLHERNRRREFIRQGEDLLDEIHENTVHG